MTFDIGHWQARLDVLRERHHVPGASLAVLADGKISELASGLLHRGTGVEATTDSVFQIGSITKVYTATMVMQLAAAGRLDIDAPVRSVLPDFAVADADATRTVTIRQLLSHTSGIDGDFFHDTGRGDDCLAKYVQACAKLGQIHPPGATMSYCNSGFIVLGRIVEVMLGQTWDTALRERILDPLGLTRTMTLPEEVLRFRAAMGHVGDPGFMPEPATVWALPRSAGSAGLICATAADVVRFARLHLDSGRTADGTELLPADQVAAMQRRETEMPDRWSSGAYWGLGWSLFDWTGGLVIGHDGSTIGQYAFLRAVPAAGVAIVLLTNGGVARELYREIFQELLAELAHVEVPTFAPPDQPSTVDVSGYAGTYERESLVVEVRDHDGVLHVREEATGELEDLDPGIEMDLVPVADGVFAGRRNEYEPWRPVVFYTLPDGTQYLHLALRAAPRAPLIRDFE